MAPTNAQVLAAVKGSGVQYVLTDGWDDPKSAASGTWDPQYVIQHHTANGGATGNSPSLAYVQHDKYAPIRACHFLIGRDGTVYVVYGQKCYHAGAGGPGHWGTGPEVPLDSMNGHAYGIEVESKGASTMVSLTDGITPAQFKALTKLNVALLKLIGAPSDVGRLINHRTWAPGRKNDTLYADSYIQGLVKAALAPPPAPPVAPGVAYVPKRVPFSREIKHYAKGTDVDWLLTKITPEGPAQLAANGVNSIYNSDSIKHVQKYQLNRPKLWGELARKVVGQKTWTALGL